MELEEELESEVEEEEEEEEEDEYIQTMPIESAIKKKVEFNPS